jgi:hypothetical protein
MCWNKDISFNTFLFGILTLFFIYYTNTYSKYKSSTFKNPLVYLFLLSVISIQLIESFLWKNLNNKSKNEFYSKIASVIIIIQMLTLILMIPNKDLKYIVLGFFVFFMIIHWVYYHFYSVNQLNYKTTIGKNGHLSWEWMNYKVYENIWLFIWLLFYIIPAFTIHNFIISFFLMISLIGSLIYFKDKTFGSMWCWIGNIFFLYFIIDILLIKPFYEYNSLC